MNYPTFADNYGNLWNYSSNRITYHPYYPPLRTQPTPPVPDEPDTAASSQNTGEVSLANTSINPPVEPDPTVQYFNPDDILLRSRLLWATKRRQWVAEEGSAFTPYLANAEQFSDMEATRLADLISHNGEHCLLFTVTAARIFSCLPQRYELNLLQDRWSVISAPRLERAREQHEHQHRNSVPLAS